MIDAALILLFGLLFIKLTQSFKLEPTQSERTESIMSNAVLHTIDELRAAVAALVAERDLAVYEQDVAQESLRQHQVWLQEAQAERDALRAWSSIIWLR